MAGKIKYNVAKDFLEKEYSKNKKTPVQISKIIGCGHKTIRRNLLKYNIPIRTISESSKGIKRNKERNHPQYVKKITKKKLYYLYKIKELSIYQIAKIFKCCNRTILNRLIKYNIPRRTISEGKKGKPNLKIRGKNHCHYKEGKWLIKYCINCGKELATPDKK